MRNKYPVYVLSKGRAEQCLTARFLSVDGQPFFLVVEKHEAVAYAKAHPAAEILILPDSVAGRGAVPIRNWIWQHSIDGGHARHWQLDDNIRHVMRRWNGRRIACSSPSAFAAVEDFTDRYENVAISGMNYSMFVPEGAKIKPYVVNVHVYSCMLFKNTIPYRWRGNWNADTDLCLQVLSGGLCTVLVNVFTVQKVATMLMGGGNTARYAGDGRLKMARALERAWPGVVETKRRFKRPQHVIAGAWRAFDTPLKLKAGVDLSGAEENEYGLQLVQKKAVKSETLKEFLRKAATD